MKNRNPPNFVTTKPFGNYFRNYKTQFVWLYIFQNNHFFLFSPSRGLQTTRRKMGFISSLREWKLKWIPWLFLYKQFHDPSFVSKRCYNFKRFQSDFLIFFQNYPLNQHYRDHQFCHFSTAKIPSWYMAFIRKMVFQRKSNVSPINLWNKILGQLKLRVFTTENIYGTRVIYDRWTCSCTDEYKRELRQHLKLWRKFVSFPPV